MPRFVPPPYHDVPVVDLDCTSLDEDQQREVRKVLAIAGYGDGIRPDPRLLAMQSAALGLLATEPAYCAVYHKTGDVANYAFAGPGEVDPNDAVPGYILMFGNYYGKSHDDHWFSEATGLSSDASMVLLGPACTECQNGPVHTDGGVCSICRTQEKARYVLPDSYTEILPCPV